MSERIFYRIRDKTNWLRHNFKDLGEAKKELHLLHSGTHYASKLKPSPDYYIVKVTEVEEEIRIDAI